MRVWDAWSGALIKELRRGVDKAEIYGVAFRPDESEVCVWSDKGTVHVFKIVTPPSTSSGSGKKGAGGKDSGEKGFVRTLTVLLPSLSLTYQLHVS